MNTFATYEELFNYARTSISERMQLREIHRELFNSILKDERQNPNRQLAIIKLIVFFDFLQNDNQCYKTYKVLAQLFAQCTPEEDTSFLEYVLLNQYKHIATTDKYLSAMVWVMRYIHGTMQEFEESNALKQLRYLDESHLGFPFKSQVRVKLGKKKQK